MKAGRNHSVKSAKPFIPAILLIAVIAAAQVIPGSAGESVRGALSKTFSVFRDSSGAFDPSVLVSCAAAIFLVWLISSVIKAVIQKTGRDSHGRTVAGLLTAIVTYAAWIIAILWCLILLGVNVAGVFAGLGIISLVFGFAAESLIEDVITGFFIIFEHQYDIGDVIVLDDFRGTVEKIGVRTTTIRDTGNNLKVVNNSDIRNFQNRSRLDSVAISRVGISYSVDLEAFEQLMSRELPELQDKYPSIFTGPSEYRGIDSFEDSSMTAVFTTPCREEEVFNAVRFQNRELKILFDRLNIEIPFPQVDVHKN